MAIKTKSDFLNALVQAKIFPEKGEMLVQDRDGFIYASKHQPVRSENGWKMSYVGEELRPMGKIVVFLGWHCATVTHGEMNVFLNKMGTNKQAVMNTLAYHRPPENFDLFLAKGYVNKSKDAEARKLDFNLDFEDWRAIYATKHCPVTGREMIIGIRKEGVPCPDDLLTIERLNPRLGYVKGNVVAMSYIANNAKSQIDQFVHLGTVTDAEKVKLLRKSLYQLEKELKNGKPH